jgi:hypothetical protein
MTFFGTCYPLTYNSKQIGSIDHCYNYVKHLIIQESWYAPFPCATKEISSVLFVYLTVIVLIMSRHIIHRSGLFIYVCFWSPAREKGTRGTFETLDIYKSTFWFLWNNTPRRKPRKVTKQSEGSIRSLLAVTVRGTIILMYHLQRREHFNSSLDVYFGITFPIWNSFDFSYYYGQ